MAIRLSSRATARTHLVRLAEVLRASPGACPVQLVLQLDDGAEATLAISRDLRVEPSDLLLASLEKLFGEKVAELR